MSAVQAVRGARDPLGPGGRGGHGEPEDHDGSTDRGAAVDVDDRDVGPATAAVPRSLGLLLAIGGAIGFVAAFVLTVERFRLAEDPGYVPSCSVNPILSCGSVMKTDQASLLGFPNPLMGIAAFAIATTLGLLVLSRTPLPRWIWVGLQVGITVGMAFVAWLAWQSLYSIGALCPYCMVVWAVVIPMFVSVTATNLDRGVLPVPAGARGAATALSDYRVLVVAAMFLVVVVLAGVQFWDGWLSMV